MLHFRYFVLFFPYDFLELLLFLLYLLEYISQFGLLLLFELALQVLQKALVLVAGVGVGLLDLEGAVGDGGVLDLDLLLLLHPNVFLCFLYAFVEGVYLALFLVELLTLILYHLLQPTEVRNLVLVDRDDALVLVIKLSEPLIQLIQVLLMSAVKRVNLLLVSALRLLDFALDRVRHLHLDDSNHLLYPNFLYLSILLNISLPSQVLGFKPSNILVNLHQHLLVAFLHQVHQMVLLADHIVECLQLPL